MNEEILCCLSLKSKMAKKKAKKKVGKKQGRSPSNKSKQSKIKRIIQWCKNKGKKSKKKKR